MPKMMGKNIFTILGSNILLISTYGFNFQSHPDFMQLLIDARYDENLNTSGDEKNISFDQSKRCKL